MLQGIQAIIADDDEMSLEMLSSTLRWQGVQCTAATNGREVLTALESRPHTDIVLLDIQMPVMDGFEVLSQCKGNPCLSNIPVIALAANHDEKLKSLKLGADDFLAKPYDPEELELRICKLVQSRRLAQSSQKAKKNFLAIASHELRTPMAQIMGLTDMLDDEHIGNEQREIISLLKHATGGLTSVISDILNYAQLDHGALSTLDLFSLRGVIAAVLGIQTVKAEKKGIRLELNMVDEISDILIGPSFFVQKVFSILLDNAIKFTTKGEIRVTVREEYLSKHNSRFYCSVSDPGIGIPAEFHNKIFEPFVQVDSSTTRNFDGIGLGLALAKRMVEQMGGTIGVTNSEDQGSCLDFSFCCDLHESFGVNPA
ncbi:MAG: hybrid sensor histidine kinase/response regulator [Oryzomonas sp.]|uniref:ATP-binding response regulator n=1 Tax=Oryzomonas sp. TaxID=2855186 RepID=UPI0028424D80|nr:hybrid sensor histidine kinase/response regulator [Oryzomonas sp.]MDR3581182.1 hybrid sensor histidine kinase/response regulator [Oryzomonas sp.]